jgi:hypothetical protein
MFLFMFLYYVISYIYNNVYNRQKGLEREREFSILILHIDLVSMYLIFGVEVVWYNYV